MRKSLLLSTVGAVALFALPALADVAVTANVALEKTVLVFEDIQKTKNVRIQVTDPLDGFMVDRAAEAAAIVNAGSDGVSVGGNASTGEGYSVNLDASMDASITGNSGVVGVNQDVGNSVNQGNLVALAYTVGDGVAGGAGSALADSQAEASQANSSSSVTERGVRAHEEQEPDIIVPDPNFPEDPSKNTVIPGAIVQVPDSDVKSASLLGSVNGNTGITGVNQNVGNASNQHNGVSLAVGLESVAALSEAALGQANTGNSVDESGTVRTASISGSVNLNTGITAVNQNTGNFNNQSSMVAFSAVGFGGAGAITAGGGAF
jgi:hypothetical protein